MENVSYYYLKRSELFGQSNNNICYTIPYQSFILKCLLKQSTEYLEMKTVNSMNKYVSDLLLSMIKKKRRNLQLMFGESLASAWHRVLFLYQLIQL